MKIETNENPEVAAVEIETPLPLEILAQLALLKDIGKLFPDGSDPVSSIKLLQTERQDLALKLEAANRPQRRRETVLTSAFSRVTQSVLTGALLLPTGKRIVLRHLAHYEPGGEAGINFSMQGQKEFWQIPEEMDGRHLKIPERGKLRDQALASLDKWFAVESQ